MNADVVYEAGLPNGSHNDPQTITATGTFTLSDPDGLSDIKSVTINGDTILINNLGTNNTIVGPNGTLTVPEGVMIADRHIHMTPAQAAAFGLADGDRVQVKIDGPKPGVMGC